MAINMSLDTNINDELDKIHDIIKGLDQIKETAQLIRFIGIKEFCQLTGWSEKTVQELYNKENFPATDFGKEKKAEVHAIIDYFKVPRRKKDD